MKDNSVLTIKGIAIIGVVTHHILNRRLDADVRELLSILPAAFTWAVLAFFAVSGWLHAFTEEKRRKGLGEFTSNKIRRLLVPFVVLVMIYAAIWQITQSNNHVATRGEVPSTYIGKLAVSLWPVDRGTVAEQLYFLPLLFAVSVLTQGLLVLNRTWLPAVTCLLSFVLGIAAFPDSKNTGFTWGVFVWGSVSYLGGLLLYAYRDHRHRFTFLGVAALVVLTVMGVLALLKLVPLALLALSRALRLSSWRFFPVFGEASGTIYAYHTPFMLHPMVIAVSKCKVPYIQFAGTLAAAALSILICSIVYYRLRGTRFQFALV